MVTWGEFLRVDQNRQHAVQDASLCGVLAQSHGVGQCATEQFTHQRQTKALVLAKGAQSTHGCFDSKHGVGGGLAFVVNDLPWFEGFTLIVCHACLALGDDAGGKVQNHGWLITHGDADADRVGPKTGVTTIPW